MTPIDAEIVIAQLNAKIEKAQKGLVKDYGHPSTLISVLSDLRTLVTNLPRIAAEISAPPKTNADRIRQMTDEELADFFCRISQCCGNDACLLCPIFEGCAQNVMCVERWLCKEVQSDADN